MVEPRFVAPAGLLWRVGRRTNPLRFSEVSAVDADTGAGNRFDVPGGRVLYAASDPDGAFAETISRLRPSPRMLAIASDEEQAFMKVGGVPADWRTNRLIVRFGLEQPFPFVDVDAVETHTFLMGELRQELNTLGVEELDIAEVRGKNRHLTRAIAQWAYSATDDDGVPRFGGIRYMSRVGNHELWAIFDGARFVDVSMRPIEQGNAELQRVAEGFNLTVY